MAAYLGACALAAALAVPARAATPTPTALPAFDVDLTTNRGCLETGQTPQFAVGERITVTFRVGSHAVSQADMTLFDFLADGRVGAFSFGQLLTNATYSFNARVAPPTGTERLLLRARANGVKTGFGACTFIVVGQSLTATPTPATTGTATPPPTPSPTPGGALSAAIRTNRGCRETGDDPVFVIGSSIVVSFRMTSPTLPKAQADLFDHLGDGSENIFSFGLQPTNVTLSFLAQVAPPTGVERLELRASAPGVPSAFASCSFLVVTPPATRTPSPRPTRTRTATQPPPPTATPTPTATATP